MQTVSIWEQRSVMDDSLQDVGSVEDMNIMGHAMHGPSKTWLRNMATYDTIERLTSFIFLLLKASRNNSALGMEYLNARPGVCQIQSG